MTVTERNHSISKVYGWPFKQLADALPDRHKAKLPVPQPEIVLLPPSYEQPKDMLLTEDESSIYIYVRSNGAKKQDIDAYFEEGDMLSLPVEFLKFTINGAPKRGALEQKFSRQMCLAEFIIDQRG